MASAVEAYYEHYLKSVDYTFNVNTPGFIRKSVTNHRLFNQPDGKHVVAAQYSYRWIEGPQYETGKDLHFFVTGDNRSFFTIQITSDLIGYTRDGRFRIDHSNKLVTLSGNFPVLGHNGFIIVPYKGHYTISRRGGFFVDETFVDAFKITKFKRFSDMDNYLHNMNGTVFILTKQIETVSGDKEFNILQGVIEQSNSFKSHDSWYYKSSHRATMDSTYKLISARRTLFNALP